MRFILRKGIIAKEKTKEAVLRCCDFLEPCGCTTSSAAAAVKQTCCQKFTDAQEGGARLAARPGTRGLCPTGREASGAATGAPLSPAGRTPRGGLALSWPGRCPVPGRPEAAATEAAALVRRARRKGQTRLLWVFLWLVCQGKCRLFPLSASSAHLFSPGAPEGAGRGPALHSPGHTGTGRGAAAAPPERQPEGCRAKILCSLRLGAPFDPMSCLERALTVVVPVRKIRVIVRCSPHTFLTIVITKLIAGPKTDVKTS